MKETNIKKNQISSNKGITMTSLIVYIAVIFVIMAIIARITIYFRNNMVEVADVGFETEFSKLNLYLLDESKKTGNKILDITEGTQISFASGNKYSYDSSVKTIFLNDNIKICENVENCLFEKEIAQNGKSTIVVKIKINNTTKISKYLVTEEEYETEVINIQDYIWDENLISTK